MTADVWRHAPAKRSRLSRCPTDLEMAERGAVHALVGSLTLWSGPPSDRWAK